MRILLIAAAAALLMLPATRQANACEGATPLAQVTITEYSAKTDKKPTKKAKKTKHHKKKEKVEYMRAAPMK
ncbi:MAG TPA: hypothetical protein VLN61_13405 [Pseudolabrys sp.]|nr:hypothetical protein [Pseudolabrys sp.]